MNKTLVNVYTAIKGTQRFLESIDNIKVGRLEIIPKIYPGNLSRYKLIPIDIIKNNEWYIFTDTSDVIFQTDFPDFDRTRFEIIVAPENEIHRNSIWKGFIEKDKYFEDLMDRPIYNAGCYAMKGNKFLEFLKFLRGRVYPENYDQLLFNKWLISQNYLPHLSIFAPLYANIGIGLVIKKGGKWYTKSGRLISCVHANGNFKNFL